MNQINEDILKNVRRKTTGLYGVNEETTDK